MPDLAFELTSLQRHDIFKVQLPTRFAGPGAELTVQLPDGWALQVLLPNGAAEGQEIEFAVPAPPPPATSNGQTDDRKELANAQHEAHRRVLPQSH